MWRRRITLGRYVSCDFGEYGGGCFPGAEVFWIDSVPSPQPSAARPALKGEGASPCRDKLWCQSGTRYKPANAETPARSERSPLPSGRGLGRGAASNPSTRTPGEPRAALNVGRTAANGHAPHATVGWVERSDTHRHARMGFANSTHPAKSSAPADFTPSAHPPCPAPRTNPAPSDKPDEPPRCRAATGRRRRRSSAPRRRAR